MSTSTTPGNSRNYNTISPSARTLLLLKGYTGIPYARQAAELILAPEPYVPDFTNKQPGFWARVLHFEARYLSIDTLLADILPQTEPATTSTSTPASPTSFNILELSSGFSFRGLALTAHRPVYYIDTDLPELIATKQQLIDALKNAPPPPASPAPPLPSAEHPAIAAAKAAAAATQPSATVEPSQPSATVESSEASTTPSIPRGYYELRPLNALDEAAFTTIIDSMPPGPITIVNEGLLMYLGKEEKQKLCQLIRKVLLSRGGYWITADIYLKRRFEDPELQRGDTMKEFLERHKVYDNMFETFEEATEFFTSMGFTPDKEAEPDYINMSTLPYFLNCVSSELGERMRANGKTHATWRLRPTP